MSEEAGKCDVCQKPANHKCGGCHEVYYCGKEHQKAAWKTHKKICRPFKIHTNDNVGRHLKTTKDIKSNSVVLQEAPLIWGPAQHTVPLCLGCCKVVTEKNCRPCSKCGWPMCSEICEKAPCHIPECRYTVLREEKISIRNFGIIHPTYQCVTVLRCLYQKQFLPEVWKKIDLLQSHCEERKGTQKYEQEKANVAQFILRFFKLDNVFSEEEIMRVCGIVMVNSHEVPLTELPYIAIYENTSMFEHSCSPNCSKSFTNDGHILISSGSNIRKGEHLSICYTDPLWGTPSRRHHLQESKFFWCTCPRCSDPTEFGTYFSALRCQYGGCKGNLLPKTFLDNGVNEKGLDWYCDNCSFSLSPYAVQDLLERIGKDLAEMPKGIPKECCNFIETYEELLHKNHYYLTDVKVALAQQIGQGDEGGIEIVSDEDLEMKIKLCHNLINLLKTLVPAEKRLLGVLLFELHAAITEMGKRKEDPSIFHSALVDARKLLAEVVDLLKHEPLALPEGKIYVQAVTNLKDIDLVLKSVLEAVGNVP